MDVGILSWAFAAGFLVAFNPCGFAMLPAYIAYSLGRRVDEANLAGDFLGPGRRIAIPRGV